MIRSVKNLTTTMGYFPFPSTDSLYKLLIIFENDRILFKILGFVTYKPSQNNI